MALVKVACWDSTREIGEPGDTWSWEKIWAASDHNPGRIWIGQSWTVCKSGYLLRASGGVQGEFSQKKNWTATQGPHAMQGPLMHSGQASEKGGVGAHLLPLRAPHGLIKGGSTGLERQWLPEKLLPIPELCCHAGTWHPPSGHTNKE